MEGDSRYHPGMAHPATCGILAGGGSTRMGANKALLPFQGRPLLARQIEILSPLFETLLLSANDPEPFRPFGVRCVPDLLSERCALAGIHALLSAATTDLVFVVACDMPFLSAPLIEDLLRRRGDADVVLPVSDRGAEPLHAIYSRRCLPAIEDNARRGRWKADGFHDGLRVVRVRVKDEEWRSDAFSPFHNANTPEEWRAAGP